MKVGVLSHYLNLPVEESKFDIRAFEKAPTNIYDLIVDNFLEYFERNRDVLINKVLKVLKRISNKADSHPSFKERMVEIGVDDFDFEVYFNKSDSLVVRKIVDDLNLEWLENMKEHWEDFTDDYKKSQELTESFGLSDDNEKNLENAMAYENLGKTDEALKIYESMLERDSDYAPALFRSGLIYLNRDDESGIERVKLAIEKDSDFIDVGLQVILEFLERNGMKDKKKEMRDWAEEQSEIYRKKIDEAENLYLTDNFVEADIKQEQREKLKAELEKIPSIKRVYIATKKLKYSEHDLLVVGVTSKQKASKLILKGRSLENTDEIWEILNRLETPCFLLDLNANPRFGRRISKVENSLLVKR